MRPVAAGWIGIPMSSREYVVARVQTDTEYMLMNVTAKRTHAVLGKEIARPLVT